MKILPLIGVSPVTCMCRPWHLCSIYYTKPALMNDFMWCHKMINCRNTLEWAAGAHLDKGADFAPILSIFCEICFGVRCQYMTGLSVRFLRTTTNRYYMFSTTHSIIVAVLFASKNFMCAVVRNLAWITISQEKSVVVIIDDYGGCLVIFFFVLL